MAPFRFRRAEDPPPALSGTAFGAMDHGLDPHPRPGRTAPVKTGLPGTDLSEGPRPPERGVSHCTAMVRYPINPNFPEPSKAQRRRSGFSLVEVVISSAIAAVVLVALQSTVVIASKALPSKSLSATPPDILRALSQLNDDLRFATQITAATSISITMIVPDRDADAAPETITYEWNGKAGAPLTRTLNGNKPDEVCAAVESFALAYDTRTDQRPQTYTEGPEGTLASMTLSSDSADFAIKSDTWASEFVVVNTAAGVSAYRPTAVSLRPQASGLLRDGQMTVEVRKASYGLPDTTALASGSFSEFSLWYSYAWRRIELPGCRQMNPAESICIMVTGASGSGTFCEMQYQQSGAPIPGGNLLTTSNSGGSWSPQSGKALRFQLFGTVTTPDPPVYFSRCRSVTATIRGASPSVAVPAAIPVRNEPEITVTAPVVVK